MRVFLQLFQVLQNYHLCFCNLRETQRTFFFLIILDNIAMEKENNLFTLILKVNIVILFAGTIITSTARATCSSVFLSSRRNIILNQSVHVFSVGVFPIHYPSSSSSLIQQFYTICSQTNRKWFKDSRSWQHCRRTHSTEKHSVEKLSPEKVQHVNSTVRNSVRRSDNS